jgi:asparagine synthase (glutamine-hydrolysing)
MCGCAGILTKRGSVTNYLSQIHAQMLKSMQHRGPDGTGFWSDSNIVLGHNRLAIVDLSPAGVQPMESDHWVLVANCEIYNHMALRDTINDFRPVLWKGHCDAETMLWFIECFGVDSACEHFEGMFAFAAYNKLTHEVFLRVDPMGIKPLYFVENDDYLAFASTPAALTHLKETWEFDYLAFNDFLSLGSVRQSFFKGIKPVEPCHFPARMIQDPVRAVIDSIEATKMADVPVFLFLSGGIDSSVVASRTIGMNAVHLASPEKKYAEEVSKKYGIKLNHIDPQDFSALECLTDYAEKTGDCSMASMIPYITSKECVKFGKVAISANGADELFCGYDRIGDSVTDAQIFHIFRRPFHRPTKYNGNDSRLFELSTYILHDLNKTLDFASMCHGLEVRVPFLNMTVVRSALKMSVRQHKTPRGNKSRLKEYLLEEGFTKEFINRPKLGFSLHYQPSDYKDLQQKGLHLLEDRFNICPKFVGVYALRDQRYFEATAAAFYCWWEVWSGRLTM